MRVINKNKKGYALAIAIIVGIVIISLSAALLISINNEIVINKRSREKIAVKKLAEAGVEEVFYLYNNKLINLTPTEEEPDPQVEDFNGLGKIDGIGDYDYSYRNINKESKIGEIISRAIVNGSVNYTIKVQFNLQTGDIITWEEG
ncbi:hypothetical protein GCM10008905_03610 [Clostridium malenominatum]|uniref:Uncharacterized protein n=1 Tax=Clostridium malenominatum TaxID=1539 RepID=A0ABP3TTQ8_9CLOT